MRAFIFGSALIRSILFLVGSGARVRDSEKECRRGISWRQIMESGHQPKVCYICKNNHTSWVKEKKKVGTEEMKYIKTEVLENKILEE